MYTKYHGISPSIFLRYTMLYFNPHNKALQNLYTTAYKRANKPTSENRPPRFILNITNSVVTVLNSPMLKSSKMMLKPKSCFGIVREYILCHK